MTNRSIDPFSATKLASETAGWRDRGGRGRRAEADGAGCGPGDGRSSRAHEAREGRIIAQGLTAGESPEGLLSSAPRCIGLRGRERCRRTRMHPGAVHSEAHDRLELEAARLDRERVPA